MSHGELIKEIDNQLGKLDDHQLKNVLGYLRLIRDKADIKYNINDALGRVMEEDENLLKRLSK
jgi:hypothetical protein